MTLRRRQLLAATGAACSVSCMPRAAPTTPASVRTRVDTPLGSFVIAVDPAVAPVTVANYLRHVDAKLLDAGSVYRIVTLANQAPETRHKIEVVQWGLRWPDDKPTPFPPIAHETTQQTGLRHLDGTVSMARNGPGTAAGEFFICIGPQPALDFGGGRNPDGQGFAAFGQVVQGMDVVRALHARGGEKQFLDAPMALRSLRRTAD
jgi:peptidyl-prolyl cis-trans isomerase A (cyclophilin A)